MCQEWKLEIQVLVSLAMVFKEKEVAGWLFMEMLLKLVNINIPNITYGD